MSRYRNPAMKQLTEQQVRYLSRDVCMDQIERAELFLVEIESKEEYRYQDICERVTNYRSEMYPDLKLGGDEAIHDLRCFIEDMSDSLDLSEEEIGEPVLTVQEVSDTFNVSTKTVDRWRNRGLASRKVVKDNRKRIVFLQSSLDRFVSERSEEVDRSSRFSQLSDEERENIIRNARRMAREGECPSEISRRLAEAMDRSPETIRYTLKNYDLEHPETAVFPDANQPLSEESRKEIYRSYRRGVPVERLARNFSRTKNSIYRIVGEVRARQLIGQEIKYMESEEFELENADELILCDAPEADASKKKLKAPPGLPPYLASLYTVPLLNKAQERYYFCKMNYLKHKAAQLQAGLDENRPKTKEMDRIEQLLEESLDIKNFLIRSNLRLVVSIAKKQKSIWPASNFFEMISDGNMSLIRAIEKFNYMLGYKFSTYASWSIMKNYARSNPKESTQLSRFRTGTDEMFMQRTDDRGNPFQEELTNEKQHDAIMKILTHLDERERKIIICRYGLEESTEPQTLEQVGRQFGVTKERIRQLEARALKKMRKLANDNKLDIPGI